MDKEVIKVVLFEDDPDDAHLVGRHLYPRGDIPYVFEVRRAESLAAGLRLLEEGEADAVLLDLFLPDSAGLDTFLRLRGARPSLPIVVLTGLNDENVALAAMRDGAQDYILKDRLEARLLQRVLRFAVERARVTRGFLAALDSSPDGALVIVDGKVRYANAAVAELLSTTQRELTGGPSPVGEAAERARQLRLPGGRELEVRGSEFRLQEAAARLIWLRDVTGMKRVSRLEAEVLQERKAADERTRFIHLLSHEVRTPLGSVKTAVEMLCDPARGGLSPAQKELAVLAVRNVDRLEKLVTRLLEIARYDAGRPELRRRSLDVQLALREAGAVLEPEASKRGLRLELDAVRGLVVEADPVLLQEVLSNLLSNAMRFAKSRVSLAAEPAGEGADVVRFSVRDDGPGLKPEAIEGLFQEFAQAGFAAEPGGYRGTGLGLALCRRIVEAHGGRIWAGNGPLGGADFSFLLPGARSRKGTPVPGQPQP